MLQSIRDRTSGWVAVAIIGLLIIPFAFWGIGDYFGLVATNSVATVNGQEISQGSFQQRYQNQYQRLAQIFGERFDPEMIDESQLRRETLKQMINRMLLMQQVEEGGYAVSDEQLIAKIQEYPQFSQNGEFSMERYRTQLSFSGLTPALFERGLRRDLKVQQLGQAVTNSAFVTDEALAQAAVLQNQQREMAWLRIPAAGFVESVEITDTQIEDYYAANQQAFMADEEVSIAWLEITGEDLATEFAAPEDELRALYEQRKQALLQQAERQASHILISVPDSADAAAWEEATKTLQELRDQLANGADFAALAKEYSDDPGSAAQGGDLGWVSRGMMVMPFEKALFALDEKGAVSEPVRTNYGMHLIKLTDIRKPDIPAFADMRDELAAQYSAEQIEEAFYKRAEKLTELTYANPDSLQPAAEALGLEIQQLNGITRTAGSGIAVNAEVRQTLFNGELIESRINSDPIELGDNHVVVVRVTGHTPATAKPLDAVRDTIVQQLRQQKAAEQAEQVAAAVVEQVKGGATLADVAAEKNLEFQKPRFISRRASALPPGLSQAVFAAPVADNGVQVASTVVNNGDQAVYV
ncbi:MAG TPA: SurA N-terminal domain-containing protein, partial [Gammaproteobacteria bacterium]|nr:SurA N-terminal domain-containing protein [Gammaproteobacteria bacterium]